MRNWPLLILGLVGLALPVRAGTPRDELLRLVPERVGFCLVLQDLRSHAVSLRDSPFIDQLRQSSFAAGLRKNKELDKLSDFEAALKKKLGVDWTTLGEDILGEAVVLAYQPGPPGKPEQEQGLILVRARNARVLADLVERLNKVQKEEGELKELEERTYHGVTYYRRVEHKKENQPGYYFLHGPILALSSQEDILRQAIDCDRSRPPLTPTPGRPREPSGADDGAARLAAPTGRGKGEGDAPPITRRLRELNADRALFALWLNPRALDAEIEAKIAKAPPERKIGAQTFATYWKALDSMVLSLSMAEREVNLSLGLRGRPSQLPAAARRLLGVAAAPSDLWRRFPEQALLAAGGRLDGAALVEVLGSFLPEESRQALYADLNRNAGAFLGGDFVKEVLPALGPDWGLCVTAPAAEDKAWVPRVVMALRVAPTEKTPLLDRHLISTLNFVAQLAMLGHNRQHPDEPLMLKTVVRDKREVRYLAGDRAFPQGVQPAYALFGGYLLAASSVDELSRFASPPIPPKVGGDKGGGLDPASVPLLRISLKDWRAYLKNRREPLLQFLAAKNHLTPEAAERQFDNLLAGLQFVDRLELRQRSAPGQAVLTLSLRTAQPLRKEGVQFRKGGESR